MPRPIDIKRLCWLGVCGVLLFVSLSACDGINTPSSAGGGDVAGSLADGPTIVSLTPALTQMLIDMGKGGQIVGVSKDDKQLPDAARCGTYNDPLMAKILELSPGLVVTESGTGDASDVPAMLGKLSDEGVFELAVVPHSRSIAGVERALTDAHRGLGAAVGDLGAAERARRLMMLRLELVEASVADAKPPRVLMLINPSTLGAIGTGVTHDQLLRLAGATNAAGSFDTGYLTLTRSQVQQSLRPDVVLIFEPGGGALRDVDPRTRALDGLSVPAVMNSRIVVIDHPHAMLPSTALPGVLVQMASAIHPDRAEAIRQAYDMAEQVIDRQSDQVDEGAKS